MKEQNPNQPEFEDLLRVVAEALARRHVSPSGEPEATRQHIKRAGTAPRVLARKAAPSTGGDADQQAG